MTTKHIFALAAMLTVASGCDRIKALLPSSDSADVTKPAVELLKGGDLPAAVAEFEKISSESPDSVHALQGAAYAKLLAGDYAGADKLLSEAAAKASGDAKLAGEISLRRAIVALRANNLDAVEEHGKASGLPVGALLAAEVLAIDGEVEARKLFKDASAAGGVVADTANKYLAMLESEEQADKDLASVTAMWSVGGEGERSSAVEIAIEALRMLPEERPEKSELLLVWAGRAVTVGKPSVARSYLDLISAPPEGQAWRIKATEAMIAIGEGRNDEGLAIFAALAEGGAPADGLSDALATAAALTKDTTLAQQLAGTVESVAAARGLQEAGATDAAKQVAPSSSSYAKYLGGI